MSNYHNYPSVAGPSRLRTVTGVWKKNCPEETTTPSDVIEVIACAEAPQPDFARPTISHVQCVARPIEYNSHTSLDDLFALEGHPVPLSTATAPPPYSPHEYTAKEEGHYTEEEPLTLARMLFMYGFFFFPFWLAGVYILCSPLLPTPDWEAGKTEDERAYLLRILRETELKWARRCLHALSGLLVTAFSLFIVIKYGIVYPII